MPAKTIYVSQDNDNTFDLQDHLTHEDTCLTPSCTCFTFSPFARADTQTYNCTNCGHEDSQHHGWNGNLYIAQREKIWINWQRKAAELRGLRKQRDDKEEPWGPFSIRAPSPSSPEPQVLKYERAYSFSSTDGGNSVTEGDGYESQSEIKLEDVDMVDSPLSQGYQTSGTSSCDSHIEDSHYNDNKAAYDKDMIALRSLLLPLLQPGSYAENPVDLTVNTGDSVDDPIDLTME